MHLARRREQERVEVLNESRLSGARVSDDSDKFALFYAKRYIADSNLFKRCALTVDVRHIFQCNFSIYVEFRTLRNNLISELIVRIFVELSLAAFLYFLKHAFRIIVKFKTRAARLFVAQKIFHLRNERTVESILSYFIRVFKNLLRRFVPNDFPLLKNNHTVGVYRLFHVVRDEKNSLILLSVEP